MEPAAILAAFSVDCCNGFGACGAWAATSPHTVRNALMIFILSLLFSSARLALSRRVLVQERDQGRCRFGRSPPVGHDVPVLQFLAVECGVVIQILSQGGSFQGKTGKKALGPRPRKNLRVHLGIRLSCRCPSDGTGCNRSE